MTNKTFHFELGWRQKFQWLTVALVILLFLLIFGTVQLALQPSLVKSFSLIGCFNILVVFVLLFAFRAFAWLNLNARLEVTAEEIECVLFHSVTSGRWDDVATIQKARFGLWKVEALEFKHPEIKADWIGRLFLQIMGTNQSIPLTPFAENWRALAIGENLSAATSLKIPDENVILDAGQQANRDQGEEREKRIRNSVGQVQRIAIFGFIVILIIVFLWNFLLNVQK